MIETRTAGSPETPGFEAGANLRHLAWPLSVLGLLIPAATAALVFLNHSAIHSIDQASPIGVILPIGSHRRAPRLAAVPEHDRLDLWRSTRRRASRALDSPNV